MFIQEPHQADQDSEQYREQSVEWKPVHIGSSGSKNQADKFLNIAVRVVQSFERKSAGTGAGRFLNDPEKFHVSGVFGHQIKHQITKVAFFSCKGDAVVVLS